MRAILLSLLLLLHLLYSAVAQSSDTVPTPSEAHTYCSLTQPCETGFTCHVGECKAIGTNCDPPCGDKQVCHADYGTCFSDSMQPCASDNPDGYCEEPLYSCGEGNCSYNGHSACSSTASTPLMGDCGWGKICQLGQCIDRNGACSYSNLNGSCPTGSDCITGVCVGSSGSLGTCGLYNQHGSCSRDGEVCVAGACVVPASPDCSDLNPLGVCPSDQHCAGGKCVAGAPTPATGTGTSGDSGNGTTTPTPTDTTSTASDTTSTPGDTTSTPSDTTTTTELVYCSCSCNGFLAPGYGNYLAPGPCTYEQCSSACYHALGITCSASGYTGSWGGTGTIYRGVVTGQCIGSAGSGSGGLGNGFPAILGGATSQYEAAGGWTTLLVLAIVNTVIILIRRGI